MVVTAGGVPSETVCTQAQATVDAVIDNIFFPSVHAAARTANRLLSQARGRAERRAAEALLEAVAVLVSVWVMTEQPPYSLHGG